MGPPGGARSVFSPRLLRHFNIVSLANYDERSMNTIFRTILKWHFKVNNHA